MRLLPESARWLLIRGKTEDVKQLVMKAASVNRCKISPELLNQMAPEEQGHKGNVLDLFKHPHLRKVTLILTCVWFVDSLVYYGISFQVGEFGLDIYLTQLIFGAIEVPARLSSIFTIERFGRKWSQSGTLIVGGVMCVITVFIPSDQPIVVTVLAVLGKFASTASFIVSYVYTAELFPTVIRQTGMGFVSVFSRVGGIITPLVLLLGDDHTAIPMLIFGSTATVAGVLCVLLPETRGLSLQDTIQDLNPCPHPGSLNAETLGRGKETAGNSPVQQQPL